MTRIAAKLSLLASAALLLFAGTALANEKCASCHADIVAKHATTLHGKAGKDCASCHGGVDAHLANPSKSNIISFSGKGDAKVRNAQCQSCHGSNQKLMFWDNSYHKKEGVSCASCHSVHKSPKPYAKQPEKCFECHKNIKSQANKISHHPIIEGKVSCSDCHNPHGTLGHGMIKAENTNQLCYKCHADKRGPYIWEHPPVEEDCLKCHTPHGSKAAKLTVEKMPDLCQRCHSGSSHPTYPWSAANNIANQQFQVPNTGSTTAGSVTNASGRFFTRSCVNCHQTIHGSNAPGTNGKRFTR